MRCPKVLKKAFSDPLPTLNAPLVRDQIFQEMVADYRQLLTVLDEQFTCMGGPDEIAVKDISAALAELEEDLRAALDVADHSRKKSSPSTDVTPQQ